MLEPRISQAVYVIIWEYRARPDHLAAFEAAYGPDGVWVRFFMGGKGYLGTMLIRDVERDGRYMTLDYWESESAYTTFLEQFASEYNMIDQQFEALTFHEARVGAFVGR